MKLFGNAKRDKSKPRKRKISPAKRRILIVCSVLLVCLAAGAIYVGSQIKPPDIPAIDENRAYYPGEYNPDDEQINEGKIAPEGVSNDDRKQDFYTFLLIGADSDVNTDTIMVVSYDDVKKEMNLLSIPRDSLVNVKRKIKKINAAYPAGTVNGGGMQGGVDQLKKEIKTLIGFIPDHYVVVNLKAFVKIVDAVDGVEVDVPFNMKYDDPDQNLHINLQKGKQVLSGTKALTFARYRRGAPGYRTISDYERIEHQQAVLKSLLERLLRPANLLKIPEFVQIFSDNVFTDLDYGNLIWFAGQLNSVRGTDALSSYTMPTAGSIGSPYYYECLDEAGIIELVNKTINPYTVGIKAEDLDIITKLS